MSDTATWILQGSQSGSIDGYMDIKWESTRTSHPWTWAETHEDRLKLIPVLTPSNLEELGVLQKVVSHWARYPQGLGVVETEWRCKGRWGSCRPGFCPVPNQWASEYATMCVSRKSTCPKLLGMKTKMAAASPLPIKFHGKISLVNHPNYKHRGTLSLAKLTHYNAVKTW